MKKLNYFKHFVTNKADLRGLAVDSSTNNAQFVFHTVPSTMISGQPYEVAVRMKNTGLSVWTKDTFYRLGSQNPQDNSIWGVGRVSFHLRKSDLEKSQPSLSPQQR